MEFWEKIQKDVSKSIKGGLKTIREKAGELTDEGKKKLKAYDIKGQIHSHMAELGAAVYSMKGSAKSLAASTKVKGLISKISALEDKLAELEPSEVKRRPQTKKAAKKSPAKKKAAKKKAKKKTA